MRIVSFGCMNDASSWHRSYMYMDALRGLGHDIFYDAASPTWSPEEVEKVVKKADVVIFGHTDNPRMFAALQVCRDLYHCKIVIDADDLVSELPKDHVSNTMYHSGSGARRLAHAMYRHADAMTVSTKRLAKHVSAINPRCYHVPNNVALESWKTVRHREKEARHRDDIRIYWGGGGGHYGDLLLVRDALLKVARENPRVKLLFGNFIPDWAIRNLPCSQAFFIPYVEYHGYYKSLAWLCADIAIAPLEEVEHNLCKSDVKYLDYAMAGIPGVYQRCEPYESVVEGHTGLKASGSDEWYARIKSLVDDPELRAVIAGNAKHDVTTNRTVAGFAHFYQAILLEVVGTKQRDAPQFEMLREGISVEAR